MRTSGNFENVFEDEFCNTWKIEEMALKYLASINLKVKLACTGLVLRRKRIKKKTLILSSCGVVPVGKLGCPMQPFVLKLGRCWFGNNLTS